MRDRWQVDGIGFSQYSILIPKFRDHRSPISAFRFLVLFTLNLNITGLQFRCAAVEQASRDMGLPLSK
jgi:hypothetical protein